jgi:hypothetical protein
VLIIVLQKFSINPITKKFLICLLSLCLALALCYKPKPSYAFVGVDDVAEIGAFALAAGAVMVAYESHLITADQVDSMKQTALGWYNGATSTVKSSLTSAYSSAMSKGNHAITLSSTALSYIDDKLRGYFDSNGGTNYNPNLTAPTASWFVSTTYGWDFPSGYILAGVYRDSAGAYHTYTSTPNHGGQEVAYNSNYDNTSLNLFGDGITIPGNLYGINGSSSTNGSTISLDAFLADWCGKTSQRGWVYVSANVFSNSTDANIWMNNELSYYSASYEAGYNAPLANPALGQNPSIGIPSDTYYDSSDGKTKTKATVYKDPTGGLLTGIPLSDGSYQNSQDVVTGDRTDGSTGSTTGGSTATTDYTGILGTISGLIGTIVSDIESFFSTMVTDVEGIYNTLANDVLNVLGGIEEGVRNVGTWSEDIYNSLANSVVSDLDNIGQGIDSLYNELSDSISNGIDSLVNDVGSIENTLSNGISGTLNGIESFIGDIDTTVSNVVSDTLTGFNQLLDNLFVPSLADAPNVSTFTDELTTHFPIVPKVVGFFGTFFGGSSMCTIHDLDANISLPLGLGGNYTIVKMDSLLTVFKTVTFWIQGLLWGLWLVFAYKKVSAMLAGQGGK